MSPDLSIIIVSFNCRELVSRCLASIPASLGDRQGEVIVVDNASADGTAEMITATFPTVRLVASRDNLGFAAGNNRGLEIARGRVIVFLNPDTEPAPGALRQLAAEVEADASIGIVGPRLTFPDGALQPSVRGFPTLGVAFLVLTKVYRLLRFLPAVQRYDARRMDYSRAADVDQLMGACLVMRREVVDAMQGFDERFWMWFEEVDLCLRVKQAGLRVRYSPAATVMHRLNQSTMLLRSAATQRAYSHSLLAYWEKHHAGWQVTLLRSVSWIGTVSASGMQAVRRLRDRSGTRYRLDVKPSDGVAPRRN